MYGGPPLPANLKLPYPIEVEFLMAAGAGMEGQAGRSWTDQHLADLGTISRPGLHKILKGESPGDHAAENLHTRLTAGEAHAEALRDRLLRSLSEWVLIDASARKEALKTCWREFDLDARPSKRRPVFAEWARRLREQHADARGAEFRVALANAGFIEICPVRKPGFRRLLDDDALPYFSRDEYAEQTGSRTHKPSEREMLEALAPADASATLLISGPGGYGKTRLARHLCLATDAQLHLQVAAQVDCERAFKLLSDRPEIRRLALLIDYAEDFPAPDPLRQLLEELAESRDIRTSLVLCCRSSGQFRASQNFRDYNPVVFALGQHSGHGRLRFEEWLTGRILGHFGLDRSAELARLCGGMPFLAAFAGFLATEHPDKFDAQFRVLAHEPEFRKWAAVRISQLAGKVPNAREHLAAVALALPLPARYEDTWLDDLGQELLSSLVDDCWVEWDTEGCRAIHDSLADVIVADYLFSAHDATRHLRNLLATADERGYFEYALTAVGRLAGLDGFERIDPVKLLTTLAVRHAGRIEASAPEIVASRLFRPAQVPLVIEQVDSLFRGLIGCAQVELSRVAADLVESDAPPAGATDGWGRFHYLLDQIAARNDTSPRVMANLLRYQPLTYRSAAQATIADSTHIDGSYLLAAYLDEIGITNDVAPHVLRWLERYGHLERAGFVLAAWFNALGRRSASAAPPGAHLSPYAGRSSSICPTGASATSTGRSSPFCCRVLQRSAPWRW